MHNKYYNWVILKYEKRDEQHEPFNFTFTRKVVSYKSYLFFFLIIMFLRQNSRLHVRNQKLEKYIKLLFYGLA